MATGAVANEQQIIFKWALKINCVVPLTQSPQSCMVNFQHLHFTAVQLVFDEQWEFFDGLQIANADVIWDLESKQLHSEPYVWDTSSISVLELFHSNAAAGKNIEQIWQEDAPVDYFSSLFFFGVMILYLTYVWFESHSCVTETFVFRTLTFLKLHFQPIWHFCQRLPVKNSVKFNRNRWLWTNSLLFANKSICILSLVENRSRTKGKGTGNTLS